MGNFRSTATQTRKQQERIRQGEGRNFLSALTAFQTGQRPAKTLSFISYPLLTIIPLPSPCLNVPLQPFNQIVFYQIPCRLIISEILA